MFSNHSENTELTSLDVTLHNTTYNRQGVINHVAILRKIYTCKIYTTVKYPSLRLTKTCWGCACMTNAGYPAYLWPRPQVDTWPLVTKQTSFRWSLVNSLQNEAFICCTKFMMSGPTTQITWWMWMMYVLFMALDKGKAFDSTPLNPEHIASLMEVNKTSVLLGKPRWAQVQIPWTGYTTTWHSDWCDFSPIFQVLQQLHKLNCELRRPLCLLPWKYKDGLTSYPVCLPLPFNFTFREHRLNVSVIMPRVIKQNTTLAFLL